METPFDELDSFVAIRRLAGLALSPDGKRLVTAVQQLNPDGTNYLTALWEVDPTGERPARRLTRSAEGESTPAFLPSGDLLFVSKRPDPDRTAKGDDDSKPALWLLPTGAGEARQLADRPGGIGAVKAAKNSGTIVFSSATMPGAKTADDDAERRKARKDAKVTAILHDAYPIRYWDHDLGPDQLRLFAAPAPEPTAADGTEAALAEPRDLTPDPRAGFDVPVSYDVSADGGTVVTAWGRPRIGGALATDLVVIDTATGERRTLVEAEDADAGVPAISPDGTQVAYLRRRLGHDDVPLSTSLWLTSLEAEGNDRRLAAELDLWPGAPLWSHDGTTIFFSADQNGRHPVFAVDVATGETRRLVNDAAYTDLALDPDGRYVYALRNAVDSPALPVRLATDRADQEPTFLRAPVERPRLPGKLEEVSATAEDGTPLRAWLVLPETEETRVPLLLWIHGGPYASWNSWHWRWNPWLAAARGYAVLLPDPALSTGYGEAFIRRGWGEWGNAPYTDLMRITDAACARDDIDADRTAALGGSFGGYMANWIAGHTDRFKAIVTHASLWALEQFGPTTDLAGHWFRELTPERAARNSPHASADQIRTPMLVIHGDKDYRVPIGEALRLWWDLASRHDGDPADLPHRFLYFPQQNHWIHTPQEVKVWYETVFGFLAWHVHDEPWERPELL